MSSGATATGSVDCSSTTRSDAAVGTSITCHSRPTVAPACHRPGPAGASTRTSNRRLTAPSAVVSPSARTPATALDRTASPTPLTPEATATRCQSTATVSPRLLEMTPSAPAASAQGVDGAPPRRRRSRYSASHAVQALPTTHRRTTASSLHRWWAWGCWNTCAVGMASSAAGSSVHRTDVLGPTTAGVGTAAPPTHPADATATSRSSMARSTDSTCPADGAASLKGGTTSGTWRSPPSDSVPGGCSVAVAFIHAVCTVAPCPLPVTFVADVRYCIHTPDGGPAHAGTAQRSRHVRGSFVVSAVTLGGGGLATTTAGSGCDAADGTSTSVNVAPVASTPRTWTSPLPPHKIAAVTASGEGHAPLPPYPGTTSAGPAVGVDQGCAQPSRRYWTPHDSGPSLGQAVASTTASSVGAVPWPVLAAVWHQPHEGVRTAVTPSSASPRDSTSAAGTTCHSNSVGSAATVPPPTSCTDSECHPGCRLRATYTGRSTDSTAPPSTLTAKVLPLTSSATVGWMTCPCVSASTSSLAVVWLVAAPNWNTAVVLVVTARGTDVNTTTASNGTPPAVPPPPSSAAVAASQPPPSSWYAYSQLGSLQPRLTDSSVEATHSEGGGDMRATGG